MALYIKKKKQTVYAHNSTYSSHSDILRWTTLFLFRFSKQVSLMLLQQEKRGLYNKTTVKVNSYLTPTHTEPSSLLISVFSQKKTDNKRAKYT